MLRAQGGVIQLIFGKACLRSDLPDGILRGSGPLPEAPARISASSSETGPLSCCFGAPSTIRTYSARRLGLIIGDGAVERQAQDLPHAAL